jgi:hypothetical protein
MENLNFEIKGKSYTTSDLRVGKIVDLWKMRTALSMGTYGQMYRISMDSADEAILAIDIEAFMTTFCSKFIEDLKPGTIRDMGMDDYKKLKDLYLSEIKPWLDEVEGLLKKSENV